MLRISSTPLAGVSGKTATRTSQDKSLYERLGGRDGIRNLIKPFYADIRQHAVLGPIFSTHIPDWTAHLEKIADFWARQTRGPSPYPGGFGTAHLSLGIAAEHFPIWLSLWEFNTARHLAPPEATALNALAHELAGRLFALTQGRRPPGFGSPELPPGNTPTGLTKPRP